MAKHIRFDGEIISRNLHKTLVAIVSMTSLKLGVSFKKIKTRERFWKMSNQIVGFEPDPSKSFIDNAIHLRATLMAMTPDEKAALISKVNKRKFMTDMGVVLHVKGTTLMPGNTTYVTRREKAERLSKRREEMYIPSKAEKDEFYRSWDWSTLRTKTIKKFGRVCMCCGAVPGDLTVGGGRVRIVVDHIKPIHHHWYLRLDPENLQVLCNECNMGKGAWDETDHRPKPVPDEWVIEDEIPQSLRDQLQIRH